jgi:hypothetical protein
MASVVCSVPFQSFADLAGHTHMLGPAPNARLRRHGAS